MKPPILMPFLFAASVYGCQMIEGDHIRGSDLAAAAPAFATLDPAAEIGLAPLPGIKRALHSVDLLQLARDHGIKLASAPPEVCFERRASALTQTTGMAPIRISVKRGDKVVVNVSAGGVLLTFESEAESSGRWGTQ